MTKGLLQSSRNLQKMRKRETGKISSNLYRSYRNLYNRLVRIAKTMHYTALIDRYKGDIAHTWQVFKLVKDLRYALSFPLSIIINNSLATGLVPDMAKLAKIIPIYKAKDKKDISNYRPISLLPIISKILEKVVHKKLYTFLEKNKVVYASQYGFRKNRSTVNAITELVCHITNAI